LAIDHPDVFVALARQGLIMGAPELILQAADNLQRQGVETEALRWSQVAAILKKQFDQALHIESRIVKSQFPVVINALLLSTGQAIDEFDMKLPSLEERLLLKGLLPDIDKMLKYNLDGFQSTDFICWLKGVLDWSQNKLQSARRHIQEQKTTESLVLKGLISLWIGDRSRFEHSSKQLALITKEPEHKILKAMICINEWRGHAGS
jgi:hypothetical protein